MRTSGKQLNGGTSRIGQNLKVKVFEGKLCIGAILMVIEAIITATIGGTLFFFRSFCFSFGRFVVLFQ